MRRVDPLQRKGLHEFLYPEQQRRWKEAEANLADAASRSRTSSSG
jgi:hypothetical protein